MNFKYFDKPQLFTSFTDKETECGICGKKTKCLDATLFYGTAELAAICPQCLSEGKLYELDIYTCEGDIEELENQLKKIKPGSNTAEIEKLAKEKTTELEKTTPHLITWQDWPWPCADGDYCRFIGFGSKKFYSQIANRNEAKELFKQSLYHTIRDISDVGELWDEMNQEEIKNHDDSANYSTLFYVFKSLHSDKIVTVWDTD